MYPRHQQLQQRLLDQQQQQQLLAQQQQQQLQLHLLQQQQQPNQALYFRYQHSQQQELQYQQQQRGYNYQSNFTNVYQQQRSPLPVQLPQPGLVRPPGIPALPGVDPSAAAMLSRQSQFAGPTVGAVAEWPMYQPVGQPPYRRSGGEPFSGHQGSFGYSQVRSGGAGQSFIGRARGQGSGGPRHFPQHGAPSTSSHPKRSVASAALPPKKPESASVLKTEVPNNQKTNVGWCEFCKAMCTSLEVLEKHKKGKRHQKNIKKIEEMKNGIKSRDELQGKQNCTSNSNLKVSHLTRYAQDGEQQKPTDNLPIEAVNHVESAETEQKNMLPGQQRASKRKHKTTSETKIRIPLICDLCNAKCDKEWIFDRHLSGKKHVANFKRFKDQQAICGPVGLQALYPPNPIAETLFRPQEGKYMPPHVYQDIPVETSTNPEFQENPPIEGSEAVPGCGSHNTVTMAIETTEKSVTAEP